ncbi:AraC family transcriptional regulator [Roseateles saccharophilus]|uniref:AraC-like DNA-binding protein n=1 Tax=Roseateles saccharophilus TaxID=304 RepID=A0A4R3UTB7_ROSSA|nr:AraC family transcriptional regulator [Roseateles saccharophilus]MDG0833687.1 AraC family transcriptional regulator [Roseateles saccharophilus]TCU93274.1 AraC-like DNA-binding protein [Roseateles saccharophilus]
MAIRLDVFDDFHLHRDSAPEWAQRYVQLSPGRMRSALVETTAPGLQVFRKWMSERVVQQGCLPAGRICFALLGQAGAGRPWMQGRELGENLVFVLRAGQDFMLQRPRGMALLACSFAAEDFRGLLDARPWSPAAAALLARPAVQAPGTELARLRSLLLARPSAASVFAALTEVFEAAASPTCSIGSASAAYVVAECHRLVAAGGDAPPDIAALARRLRISRRSLQNSFRQVADTTAVHYLRSLRLNAVRRRLLDTGAAELGVSEAAGDAGFEHLGHFGQRYRQLFGELPSQTFRKTAP